VLRRPVELAKGHDQEFVYQALLPRQLSASSINGYVRAVGHLSVTLDARDDHGE